MFVCLFLYFYIPLHQLSFCHDAVRGALCFICGIFCTIQNLTFGKVNIGFEITVDNRLLIAMITRVHN